MEGNVVRGETAKQCRERRASSDRKPKLSRAPQSVSDLLLELTALKQQTKEFFVTKRELSGSGLNPKFGSDMAVVSAAKIEEVWGKCSSYKSTNTVLKPEARKELTQLYAKIYGKSEVTNNEFMAWLVKGYIAQLMGYDVDWASAAASTAQVLASRIEGELLKRELSEEEAAEFLKLAPYAVTRPSGTHLSGPGTTATETNIFSSGSKKIGTGYVMPSITADELAIAEEVLRIEIELTTSTESKQKFLESSKQRISEKIIGCKFGMEDRNADAKEAAESVAAIEGSLVTLGLQISDVEAEVQSYRNKLDEGNKGFSVGLERLQELKLQREAFVRKLEFANFSLEDSKRRAQKARDLYQDAGLDMWKYEADIEVVRRELEQVRRHKDAVVEQIRLMKEGGGVSNWPKPCLHPEVPEDGTGVFELEACSFCNRWYTAFDAVMASCKHFYHPFCVAKLVETQNSCVICKEQFHPAWWRSFGYRSPLSDAEGALSAKAITRSMEELTESLKDSFRIPIPEWSQPKGKQSDWGSSGSTYQAGLVPPSTSGSLLKDGTQANQQGKEPKVGTVAASIPEQIDEVDSPSKGQFKEGGQIQKPGVPTAPALTPTKCNTTMVVVKTTVETASDTAIVTTTTLEKETSDEPTVTAPVVAEGPPIYSFSLKRSGSNTVDDSINRKKVTKSVVTIEGTAAGKAPKLPAGASKKTGSRRLDSRKGDKEPKIIEVPTGKDQSYVTRSRLRKD